jgi:hypothetical protein
MKKPAGFTGSGLAEEDGGSILDRCLLHAQLFH